MRITTETENFVVPLYAYPSLPDLRAVFPKIIDFGSVDVKEPTTYVRMGRFSTTRSRTRCR